MMQDIKVFLSQAAQHTPSPDNSQPWHLDWEGDILTVSYDTSRVADKTFVADSHAIFLTMGALLENVIQAAKALNVGLTWSFPNKFDINQPIYFQATLDQTNSLIASKIDDIPLFKRHTNRLPFQNKSLPSDFVSQLKNLTESSAKILVFENKKDIQQIAKQIRSASEVRFQTQEIHEWLAKSFRFDTKKADEYGEGLDVATIDLPLGGKLFLRLISNWKRMNWLNKIGTYKTMAFIDSQPVSQAPAIIAIAGSCNEFRDILAAGQLMNRAWMMLNANGIAVHPYYVITDQLQRKRANVVPSHLVKQINSVSEDIQKLFKLGNEETVHILFRVGYPKKTPVKSKRLPLKSLSTGI